MATTMLLASSNGFLNRSPSLMNIEHHEMLLPTDIVNQPSFRYAAADSAHHWKYTFPFTR